ncbi:spidroin-1-like [Panicum virgatum]|uniref:spidroin-1-like n=1 Tax=Panicum virgatum TaxID=38727 RepID=UPI0019D64E06|nr:spidroin-1-like [Panicum virgatum]
MQNCIAILHRLSPGRHPQGRLGVNHHAFAPQLGTEGGGTVHRPRRHGRKGPALEAAAEIDRRRADPSPSLAMASAARGSGAVRAFASDRQEEEGGRARRWPARHGLRAAEGEVAATLPRDCPLELPARVRRHRPGRERRGSEASASRKRALVAPLAGCRWRREGRRRGSGGGRIRPHRHPAEWGAGGGGIRPHRPRGGMGSRELARGGGTAGAHRSGGSSSRVEAARPRAGRLGRRRELARGGWAVGAHGAGGASSRVEAGLPARTGAAARTRAGRRRNLALGGGAAGASSRVEAGLPVRTGPARGAGDAGVRSCVKAGPACGMGRRGRRRALGEGAEEVRRKGEGRTGGE